MRSPPNTRPLHRAGGAAVVATATLAALSACGHAPPHGGASKPSPEPRAATAAPLGPPQYVVADPSTRGNVVALPLGNGGALGLVVDRSRIVIGSGEPKVGVDMPDQPIAGALRIPSRFKGGFLFWTDSVVYRADAFDGRLEPVARLAEGIQGISFAPKYLLVRTRNGERWALSLPSGDRAAVEPLGVVDIEGLDDGRALSFDDQGAVRSSLDGGAHWVDVTAHVKTSPSRVAVVDDELWLFESGGGALRLEKDGQLSSFDKQPPEKTPEMRAPDPRWRGVEAPLRTAFHAGAAIDESTALVLEQGDLVRVDVHTGEIVSVTAGKLPPDARCEAVPTPNDVLFACVSRGSPASGYASTSSFVVAHTISGDAPVVEQTFGTAAHFFASDDGGLVFAGPCSGTSATQGHAVCVRQPGGTWQDADLSALGADAGNGGAGSGGNVSVARWVPRGDGRVVALLSDPPGIYDPRTGSFESVPDGRDAFGQGAAMGYGSRLRRIMTAFDGSTLVDWGWSYGANGSLRGWQRHGGIVEVDPEGKLTRSPYAFDIAASGPFALGRTKDGRLYQSTDHGASWVEVAGPPSGASAGELRACTTAGCDLGGFYRVGWAVRAPRPETVPAPAKPAPEVKRTRPVELACRPAGAVQVKALRRSESSPDDLGLGAARLPVSGERGDVAFVRNAVPRMISNPLHDAPVGDSDNPSLRGMLSGFSTTRDRDVIEVTGPNKNAASLRRLLSFVPPFDPSAPIKKATIAMSDVLSAGRLAGMTNDEILQDDMTEAGSLIVVTPTDPSGASDLVFQNPRGLVAVVRANERVRVAMRPNQNDGATIVSGVALSADDVAILEVEPSGVGHVFKSIGATITDLFDVSPTMADTQFYPANPDALAANARGELAVLRTASGSDPSSALDPALLMVPSMPPVALAPWASLRLADDPACKEPGWRATLQVIAPWIRVTAPELRVDEVPMLARVKWNEKRVCLEGVEVKLPDVAVRVPGTTGNDTMKIASWLVSRGSSFARVAISEGVEWRQPLECSIATRTP